MPRKKRVRITCHGPIAASRTATSRWEDVWLRFTRPGTRRIMTLGPTLMSRSDIVQHMTSHTGAAERFNEPAYDTTADNALLARLDAESLVMETDTPNYRRGIPDVYTVADHIDRAEAERMIRYVLRAVGVHNARLIWTRPVGVIIPV